jgi:predicted RNA binding protein YcfA (HicA-like mRNA interferase family)
MKAWKRGGQVRMLVEWAQEHGWHAEKTNGDHIRFTHPRAGVVFSSFTPSDQRAYLNARGDMRRKMKQAGYAKESVR